MVAGHGWSMVCVWPITGWSMVVTTLVLKSNQSNESYVIE